MLFGRYIGDRGKWQWCTFIVYIAFIMLFITSTPFAQDSDKPSVLRSRAFRLKHIGGEDCRKQLETLGIGTKIDLLGKGALIVTSTDVGDLIKASSIVTLIDTEEKYAIKRIGDWSVTGSFVSSDTIAEKLDGVTVGTFSAPPFSGSKNGTIVDVHNSSIIAIAPKHLIDNVVGKVSDMISGANSAKAESSEEKPDNDKTTNSKTVEDEVSGVEERVIEKSKKSEKLDSDDFFQAELFKSLSEVELKSEKDVTEPKAVPEPEKPVPAPIVAEPQVHSEEAKSADSGSEAAADPNVNTGGKEEEVGSEQDARMLELVKMLQQQAKEEEEAWKEQVKTESAAEPTPLPKPHPGPTPKPVVKPVPKPPVRRMPTPKVTNVEPELSELDAAKAEIEKLRRQLEGKDIIGDPKVAVKSAVESTATENGEEDATIPEGEEEIQTVITLPEKVEITALIELVGKQLKLNYMYDPQLVTGEVMLKIHDGKIKVKDMYSLLESVLKFRGFLMTRRGNLVTVIKGTDATGIDPVIRDNSDDIQPGDVIVTSIYKLEHISVATAQTMLTQMKLGLSFIPIEDTKTLVVTGYAYRMERIEKILKMIDVKGKDRKFISRKLQYVLPSELTTKLQTLAKELGTVSITVGEGTTTTPTTTTPTTTRKPPVSSRTTTTTSRPTTISAASKQPVAQGVFIDTDDRTNSILMVGLEEDIETVNMLVESLDVEKHGLKSIVEYQIQYIEATEVLDSLSELGVISSYGSSRQSSSYPRSTTTDRTTPTTSRTASSRTTTASRTSTSYNASRTGQVAGDEPQIAVRLATNSLLVNATAEQHKEITMVIKFVDVEQEDLRSVREYEIQYVDSTEIVDTLSELGIIEPKASSTSSRRTTSSPTSRTSATSTAARTAEATTTTTFAATTGAEITSDQPQIAVLESTNSLLVYATPKQHETIALVVAHVDRELTEISTPYVIYALENQDPEELVVILNDIVQATIKEAEKSQDSKVTTAVSSRTREKNDIQIVSDPKTYSLIVYADKKHQQWLSSLIEELDAYRPQVLLDVTLAEILRTDDFTLDLQSAVKTAGGSSFDLLGTLGKTGELLTTFPKKSINEATAISGRYSGFLADEHAQLLIDAVQRKNYGRILSRPTLLVDDNQEGTLDSKETTYITRTSSILNPGTSSGTSTTSTNEVFEAYDAGISLAIKPHISKGDNLRLEITLSQSEFLEATTDKPPDTTTRDIVTVVTVPDRSTIILGGLEDINQTKGGSKVPLLGDIPLIGGLFRSTKNTDSQSKLYIFIKAQIMRPGSELTSEDLIDISSRSKRDFERRENEMQEYQDWPGIKPQPMPPLHVLDDPYDEEDETY